MENTIKSQIRWFSVLKKSFDKNYIFYSKELIKKRLLEFTIDINNR